MALSKNDWIVVAGVALGAAFLVNTFVAGPLKPGSGSVTRSSAFSLQGVVDTFAPGGQLRVLA